MLTLVLPIKQLAFTMVFCSVITFAISVAYLIVEDENETLYALYVIYTLLSGIAWLLILGQS